MGSELVVAEDSYVALQGGGAVMEAMIANLGAGELRSTGISRIEGTSAATRVDVNSGQLTLASPDRLLDTAAAHPVERLRQTVRDAIQARVAEPGAAGVLAALAVGDQAAIARDDWALFRDTGVAHLMSISGLHVTMFAWLAGAVVGALWRRHPSAPRWLPAPVAGRWAGLMLAAAYALLAGWGVPAQRTVAMIAVVVLLRQAGRRWPLAASMTFEWNFKP